MSTSVYRRYHLDRRVEAILSLHTDWADDKILTTGDVADWLGVVPHWCEVRRMEGDGPSYIRLSPKRIRYRAGDVRAWLRGRVEARLDLAFGERGAAGRTPRDLPAEVM